MRNGAFMINGRTYLVRNQLDFVQILIIASKLEKNYMTSLYEYANENRLERHYFKSLS